jgi:hypothetical protein
VTQDQSESLLLSLLLLFLLLDVCQSMSQAMKEPSIFTASINAVYASTVIIMVFNFGALKAVREGEDLELWMNDSGIELVFLMIMIMILMSLGSFSQMFRHGSLI